MRNRLSYSLLPGAILLACLLLAPPALAADALLSGQIAKLHKSRPGVTELYVLSAGMSSKQDVFRYDVESMRDLLDRYWGSADRSVALVALEETKSLYAYPTRANLTRAAEGIRSVMDPAKDVLLVFLSSHGTTDGLLGTLPQEREYNFSPVDMRKLLESSGAKYRIVIVSACHAAVMMREIADDNTLILTAADGARTSFGCNFRYSHTWFTDALMNTLAQTANFEQAFRQAAASIEQREFGGEAFEHSSPQMHVGAAARIKVAEIEAKATRAAGWEPPVLKTEAGKVRQMLGDYLAIDKPAKSAPQVYWLQLKKLGAPAGGVYPVEAWAQLFYSRNGDFSATYDATSRAFNAKIPRLAEFQFTLDGNRFVGAIVSEAGPRQTNLVFEKVLRRDIYEAAAANPPTRLRAKPASKIRLLYISADDCSYCRLWERDHLQGGRLTSMPEYKQIEFLVSKRISLKQKLREGDLPKTMEQYYAMLEKSHARVLTLSPSFVLMVDDQVRMTRSGPFLDSPIYPILRAAVRERDGKTDAR